MRFARGWPAGLCALIALAVAGCAAGGAPLLPTPVGTSPPTQTSGPVSIATDHGAYAGNDIITVTITNHTAAPIYAWDTRASCSILDLQVRQGVQWVGSNALYCPLGRVALAVKVAPGAPYSIRIGSPIMSVGTNLPLAGGAYRLALTYYNSPSLAAQAPGVTVYSATLIITGVAPPPVGT